ncbi:hypothetical protein PTI98_000667 [Pleurotus ostreatus]|nr:hypothetical protein PTI98_000667 [Pleurotus ostreatus]
MLAKAVAPNLTKLLHDQLASTTSRPLRTLFLSTGGALYACSVLALLIAYMSGSNGQYPALDIVVGIRSCLIFLQIHSTSPQMHEQCPPPETRTIFRSCKRQENEGGQDDQTFAYPMQPVAGTCYCRTRMRAESLLKRAQTFRLRGAGVKQDHNGHVTLERWFLLTNKLVLRELVARSILRPRKLVKRRCVGGKGFTPKME